MQEAFIIVYAKWNPVLALKLQPKINPALVSKKKKKLLCHCLLILFALISHLLI